METKMYYKKLGSTIRFDIGESFPTYKDYFVECNYLYDYKTENYLLNMRLGCKSIDERMMVDVTDIDTQHISGDKRTIIANIRRIVIQACKTGFFDEYVKHFEFVLKCFDIGYEVLEEERSKKIKEEMNKKEENNVNDSNNDKGAA